MINYGNWNDLDEQGRYEVWSAHLEAGGEPFSFFEFCDLLDQITALAISAV